MEPQGREEARSLTAIGITLLGVVLSIGATVGFGITGAWWLRLLAAAAVALGLALAIKLGSTSDRGPLARFAKWILNAPFR